MSVQNPYAISLIILLGFGAPASEAVAQSAAVRGPIDITADSLEVIQPQCLSIWRGGAEALQDDARLRADLMRVFGDRATAGHSSECGNIGRIEAEGAVFYVSRTGERARGDAGVYDLAAHSVTLSGDVVAVQGQNVLTGGHMTFDTATGVGRMSGKANGKSRRPRAVFYPKSHP